MESIVAQCQRLCKPAPYLLLYYYLKYEEAIDETDI